MIRLDEATIEAVNAAAEQNRKAGTWVAPSPAPAVLDITDLIKDADKTS